MVDDEGGQARNVDFEFDFSAIGAKGQIGWFSTAASAQAWLDSHLMLVRTYDHCLASWRRWMGTMVKHL